MLLLVLLLVWLANPARGVYRTVWPLMFLATLAGLILDEVGMAEHYERLLRTRPEVL